VTAIQGYLNHPDIERRRAIEAIRFLNQPMLKVQVTALRRYFREFQSRGDIKLLLDAVENMRKKFGWEATISENSKIGAGPRLTRDDLRLICFELVTRA
jgi:hypothetical protein